MVAFNDDETVKCSFNFWICFISHFGLQLCFLLHKKVSTAVDSTQGGKELLIIIFQQYDNQWQRQKGKSGSLLENNLQNKNLLVPRRTKTIQVLDADLPHFSFQYRNISISAFQAGMSCRELKGQHNLQSSVYYIDCMHDNPP